MQKQLCILNIKDGIISNPNSFYKMIAWLKDGKYQMEVSRMNKRTNPMNRYYWFILTHYVQPGLYEAGWSDIKTKEDAHIFVSNLFLRVKMVNENTGEVMERVRSTTELSKEEMSAYWEEIWRWSATYLGVAIPSPNQQFVLYE